MKISAFAIARGGVIGRIGPEMTPECDCAGAPAAAGAGTAARRGEATAGGGAGEGDFGGAATGDLAGAAGNFAGSGAAGNFAGSGAAGNFTGFGAAGDFTGSGATGLAVAASRLWGAAFATGFTTMLPAAAFGACTATDAVISPGLASALASDFVIVFTLGSGFGAPAVLPTASDLGPAVALGAACVEDFVGIFGAAGVFGAAGLTDGLGLRAEVNFFTVAGLEDDSRLDFAAMTGLAGDGFLAVASFADPAAGRNGDPALAARPVKGRPAEAGVLRFAAVLSPLFRPPMLQPQILPGAEAGAFPAEFA